MMKTKKDFDAVKMMREIRESRHAEYQTNPELRESRLEAIKEIYSNKIKRQENLRRKL